MIHWIGQCQSRSTEYTGSETLSEGVHSRCMVEPSPVPSASAPPSAGCRYGYDCRRQCLSVVYTVSGTLSDGSMSPLLPFLCWSLPPSTDAFSLTTTLTLASTAPPINGADRHSVCFLHLWRLPIPLLPPTITAAPTLSMLTSPTAAASPHRCCLPQPQLPPPTAAASPHRCCLPPLPFSSPTASGPEHRRWSPTPQRVSPAAAGPPNRR